MKGGFTEKKDKNNKQNSIYINHILTRQFQSKSRQIQWLKRHVSLSCTSEIIKSYPSKHVLPFIHKVLCVTFFQAWDLKTIQYKLQVHTFITRYQRVTNNSLSAHTERKKYLRLWRIIWVLKYGFWGWGVWCVDLVTVVMLMLGQQGWKSVYRLLTSQFFFLKYQYCGFASYFNESGLYH